MSTDQVQFYVRHRTQIAEWAALRTRVDRSIRDAVSQGSADLAISIFSGESGDAEVDFFVRNRALIAEWGALRASAGLALHTSLVTTATAFGCRTTENKRGWTTTHLQTPELVDLAGKRNVSIELAWMRGDLLTTGRGYPFPRIAIVLNPARWTGQNRAAVIAATRARAQELGMKRPGDTWWAHWGELDGIAESEDLGSYAERCFLRLRQVSEEMRLLLLEATERAVTK